MTYSDPNNGWYAVARYSDTRTEDGTEVGRKVIDSSFAPPVGLLSLTLEPRARARTPPPRRDWVNGI